MAQKIWFIYDYMFSDEKRAARHVETWNDRRTSKNSFVRLTTEVVEHLEPCDTAADKESGIVLLDCILAKYGCDLTDKFIQDELWDLYEQNLKRHKESIETISRFNLIDELSNKEFEYERFYTKNSPNQKKNKYIYFLYKNDEVVYVGKTEAFESNKTDRPSGGHNEKDFDYFEMIQLDDDADIKIAESYFIMKHKPLYNKSLPISGDFMAILKYHFKTTWDPYTK